MTFVPPQPRSATPDSQAAAGRWIVALHRSGGPATIAAMAAPLLSGALLLVQAWLLAAVLAAAIVEHRPLAALALPVAGIAALVALRAAIAAAGEMLAVRAAEAIKRRLRLALFDAVAGAREPWTASRSAGALAGLPLEQVEAMDGFLVRYMPALVQATVLPLTFAITVAPVDWLVALLFLVTAPLIPVFMALVGWGAESATEAQAAALSRLGGRFADRLRGLVTLRLLGHADDEVAAAHAASEDLRVRSMRVLRIAFLSSAVLEFFAALGVAGVALYVGLTFLGLVGINPGLGYGAGLFCLLMAPEVYQPLRVLAAHHHDRAGARAATIEMSAQLGTLPQPARESPSPLATAAPAVLAAAGPLDLAATGVALVAPGGRPLLADATLVLRAGEHVALTGASGVGKSTLLEALARLRDMDGDVRIGGVPLADIPERELRRRVTLLGQRPRIVSGTIAANIRVGCPDAGVVAVRDAARLARVTDFADALPDGLETRIGEDGLGLSGGEAQRVALARLYLRDPALVLLDEPTAHLDAATEAAVLDGLLEFAEGRTLLVSTHSAAVVRRMDRALRLVGGQLLAAPGGKRRRSGGAVA